MRCDALRWLLELVGGRVVWAPALAWYSGLYTNVATTHTRLSL